MRFADYSPPSSPSLEEQRDALQKGLGRTMQWAMARRLDDGPLLAACLRDQCYDVQLEASRGDWLWRIIRAVGAADRFRVPILHALYALSDDRSANQLCELARCYAEMGDEPFRMRLYEIVEQKPIADSHWLGEEEIIQLDGEKAFLFAARVRGESLDSRAWEWDDNALVGQAIERFGEERVNNLLNDAKAGALRSYREGWLSQKQAEAGQEPPNSHREEMRALTVGDIILAAESNDTAFSLFRGWGIHASEVELGMVLHHLRSVREPTVIANLLQVFSNREALRFDTRLIELCQHNDTEIRRRALFALENVEHPLVREFALSELETGVHAGSVAGLFIRNYQQGDEHRILERIELPDDDDERHWLLMDVVKLLEANPNAQCFQLGVIAYSSTPCENCRFHAARLLIDQEVAPEWLVEECRFDSSEESRGLVEKIL